MVGLQLPNGIAELLGISLVHRAWRPLLLSFDGRGGIGRGAGADGVTRKIGAKRETGARRGANWLLAAERGILGSGWPHLGQGADPRLLLRCLESRLRQNLRPPITWFAWARVGGL